MLYQVQSGKAAMRAGLVVAWCIAVASCAASKPVDKSTAPSAAPEAGAAELAPDPREEIRRLDAQIAESRTQLGLDEPTPAMLEGVSTQPMSVAPSSEDPTCKPAPTERCKTSCDLSDSICENAQKICDIAEQLQGDTWAAGMCAKANKTCEGSRAKCCGCQ